MFTGLIHHCGSIRKVERGDTCGRFWVESQFKNLSEGDSICVDGVCLTACSIEDGLFAVDISPETWTVTALSTYGVGDLVNLERPLAYGEPLGGHLVSGHVDQTIICSGRLQRGNYLHLDFTGVSDVNLCYLVKKGSVAVQGVSLTINEVSPQGFSVLLIPETQKRTHLGRIVAGNKVHVEFDWVAKLFLRQVELDRSH